MAEFLSKVGDAVTPTKPSKEAVNSAGVGLAVGLVVTWLIGFAVTVPGEIGAAIGTISTFVVHRYWDKEA